MGSLKSVWWWNVSTSPDQDFWRGGLKYSWGLMAHNNALRAVVGCHVTNTNIRSVLWEYLMWHWSPNNELTILWVLRFVNLLSSPTCLFPCICAGFSICFIVCENEYPVWSDPAGAQCSSSQGDLIADILVRKMDSIKDIWWLSNPIDNKCRKEEYVVIIKPVEAYLSF